MADAVAAAALVYFTDTDLMLSDSNGTYGNVLCEPDVAPCFGRHIRLLTDTSLI